MTIRMPESPYVRFLVTLGSALVVAAVSGYFTSQRTVDSNMNALNDKIKSVEMALNKEIIELKLDIALINRDNKYRDASTDKLIVSVDKLANAVIDLKIEIAKKK